MKKIPHIKRAIAAKSSGAYNFDNGVVVFGDLLERIGKVQRNRQRERERYKNECDKLKLGQ